MTGLVIATLHCCSTMADHDRKIERAHEHLKWIDEYLLPWKEGERHTEVLEPDPERQGNLRLMAVLTEEPAEYPLSVVVGECLHNLRSALDLLAYSLAVAYTKPLPDDIAESSEFPIFGDIDRRGRAGVGAALFRDNGRSKIRGIDPAAQTEVERMQPYHRGTDFRLHPLWQLQVLDNINKHRLLHVVAVSGGTGIHAQTSDPTFDMMKDWPFVAGELAARHEVLRVGQTANVGSFPLRTDIRPEDMKVKPQTMVVPVFDDVPIQTVHGNRPSVIQTLADAFNYIWTDVLPPLQTYL
jgi:hypothetical protein